MYYGYGFRPYVSVGQRRAQAAREVEKRRKKGQTISPVVIDGRSIATTFWGKAWCDNLESYSDYENRLPRGRTYVRNGSVVDLQILPGKVTALVSGSELYEVAIGITPLPAAHWRAIKARCAGEIGSLVELLQGRLSKSVMEVVTAHEGGLFPKPREITFSCSCPDWASMCKHVAAVLYGVGARLDHEPALLFLLRQVDHMELIAEAVPQAGQKTSTKKKTLAASELESVFGIELATPGAAESGSQGAAKRTPGRRKPAKSIPATKVKAPASKAIGAASPSPGGAKSKPAGKRKPKG